VLVTAVSFAFLQGNQPMTASPETVDAMYAEYSREFPNVKDITVDELLSLNGHNVVLVDVRTSAERAISTIPGSISVAEYESRHEQFTNSLIVPFCTIGYRSGVFAQNVSGNGHCVQNLRGGILAWCHAGQSVSGAGRSGNVHVYGRRWNLLPDGYQGVW